MNTTSTKYMIRLPDDSIINKTTSRKVKYAVVAKREGKWQIDRLSGSYSAAHNRWNQIQLAVPQDEIYAEKVVITSVLNCAVVAKNDFHLLATKLLADAKETVTKELIADLQSALNELAKEAK